jgi:uncharacterized protein YbjT (DUF2867 family)
MNNRIIAVAGATGLQGNAVARRLLAEGWKVRALTRDLSKPAAIELASLGAEIVPGDMDHQPELAAAFAGAYGVFSVQNFWLPEVGFDGEVRQGKNVAYAASESGVQHLVYSSVGAAHRGMGQKHFDSKWIIEQYIKELGIPSTILRPAAFMENHKWQKAQILNGKYTGRNLRPEKGVQSIAVVDVAVFAGLAFADAASYLGRTIELAGDELTESQTTEVFARVIGRPVELAKPSLPDGKLPNPEMTAMYHFFNGEGYDADITALRKLHPELLTLEQYLRKNGWENAQPVATPEGQGMWGG